MVQGRDDRRRRPLAEDSAKKPIPSNTRFLLSVPIFVLLSFFSLVSPAALELAEA